MDPVMKDSIHRILKPLVCQLPEPSWKPGLEAEATRTGPPLAVISESVPSASQIAQRSIPKKALRNRRKSIILVHPYQENEPKLNCSENLLVQLLDDEYDQEPSGSESMTLYPVDQIKACKTEQKWMRTIHKFPDFNVWMYHSKNLRSVGNKRFDQIIQEKLPFSFVWLLGEMSHLIYQSKRNIYQQLVKIEISFKESTKKRASRNKRK